MNPLSKGSRSGSGTIAGTDCRVPMEPHRPPRITNLKGSSIMAFTERIGVKKKL